MYSQLLCVYFYNTISISYPSCCSCSYHFKHDVFTRYPQHTIINCNQKKKRNLLTDVCLGWPSFSDLMKEDSITESDDFSIGMHRLEVACSQVNSLLSLHLSLLLLSRSDNSAWSQFCMLFSVSRTLYSSLLVQHSIVMSLSLPCFF